MEKRKYILTHIFILLSVILYSQNFDITELNDTTVYTCSSHIACDNYEQDEIYVFTVYSDDEINKQVVFWMNGYYAFPNDSYLKVYDGNSIGSPLIAIFDPDLLHYDTLEIKSSKYNSDGCLTFEFMSHMGGCGWNAEIKTISTQ